MRRESSKSEGTKYTMVKNCKGITGAFQEEIGRKRMANVLRGRLVRAPNLAID